MKSKYVFKVEIGFLNCIFTRKYVFKAKKSFSNFLFNIILVYKHLKTLVQIKKKEY